MKRGIAFGSSSPTSGHGPHGMESGALKRDSGACAHSTFVTRAERSKPPRALRGTGGRRGARTEGSVTGLRQEGGSDPGDARGSLGVRLHSPMALPDGRAAVLRGLHVAGSVTPPPPARTHEERAPLRGERAASSSGGDGVFRPLHGLAGLCRAGGVG